MAPGRLRGGSIEIPRYRPSVSMWERAFTDEEPNDADSARAARPSWIRQCCRHVRVADRPGRLQVLGTLGFYVAGPWSFGTEGRGNGNDMV
ncbi:MAG: hypothetical protein M3O70_23980, partial [Actinomycetota bacterium]|nr:hypothetical protein [Actinomycetota bacterium]